MPKIELTIDPNYLPDWGVGHGIRELLQNGMDAQDEFKAPLHITHSNNTLRIENKGVTLPLESLLIGSTTKVGKNLRGQFGEGLKLGILALVRAGFPVKIRNGGETWVPSIEQSSRFNCKVLVFNINRGNSNRQRVRVEIGNIKAEAWSVLRDSFLFLNPPSEEDVLDGGSINGKVLLEERFKGKVFLKGIFVEQDDELDYGYDLATGDVDRDRKMLSRYNRNYAIQSIWLNATYYDNLDRARARFWDLLENGSKDLEGISLYNASLFSPGTLKYLDDQFRAKHGKYAVPCYGFEEAQKVGHFGVHGVIVPQAMRNLLVATYGDLDKILSDLGMESSRTYTEEELTKGEWDVFNRCFDLVSGCRKLERHTVSVVDFRNPDFSGTFDPKKNTICLSRKVLTDFTKTLRILIHEVAHRMGGDGDKAHVEEIEQIWMAVTKKILLDPAMT